MTEAEYKNANLTIDDAGIWCGDRHVMPSAEDGLIQAVVRRLCEQHEPATVLEIGFGLGLSATAFQDYGVAAHCIIEAHPMIAERARKWAIGRPGVTIIEGFGQTCPIPDGAWELVFDDRYEMTDIPMDRSRFVHGHWYQCDGFGLEGRD